MKEKETNCSLITVELNDSWTQASRDITVPAEIKLGLLDKIIHLLFGWNDDKPAVFFLGLPYVGVKVSGTKTAGAPYDFAGLTLRQAFRMAGKTIHHVIGADEHLHIITLKKDNHKPTPGQYPIYCVKSDGPRGYDNDTKASPDDEYLFKTYNCKKTDLFSADGRPSRKYFELRTQLSTPLEILNEDLAALCDLNGLMKTEAAQDNANPGTAQKGKYCLISVTLDDGITYSTREIAVPAGIKLGLLELIIARLFGWVEDPFERRQEKCVSACFLGSDLKAPVACDPKWKDCDYAFSALTLKEALQLAGGTFLYLFHHRHLHTHVVRLLNADHRPENGQYPILCTRAAGPKGRVLKSGRPYWEKEDKKRHHDLFALNVREAFAKRGLGLSKAGDPLTKPDIPLESINEELAKFCYSHRFHPVRAAAGGSGRQSRAAGAKSAPAKETAAMPETQTPCCLISIELRDRWNHSKREIAVPKDLKLNLLNSVILNLFGWDGDHMTAFFLGRPYGAPCVCDTDYEEGQYDFDELTVQQAFNKSGKTFSHVYDYGDDHFHYITLKKKNYALTPGQYPIYCVKAQGPRGYAEDEGMSNDDEQMLAEYRLMRDELIDDDGMPLDKYFELRSEFTTPMEILNGRLTAICKDHKLEKITACVQKAEEKTAPAAATVKTGKYCVISVRLNESATPSLREIAVPADIKLGVLKNIITVAFGWTGEDWRDWNECRVRAFFLGDGISAPAACNPAFKDCDYDPDALTLREALEISAGALTYVFCQKFKHIHHIKLENADYKPRPGQYPVCCLKSEGPMGDVPHDRAADQALSEHLDDFRDDDFELKIRDFLAAHREPGSKELKGKEKTVKTPESLNEELAKFCSSHGYKPLKGAADGTAGKPDRTKAKAQKSDGADA